jgi:hypothetical protein
VVDAVGVDALGAEVRQIAITALLPVAIPPVTPTTSLAAT